MNLKLLNEYKTQLLRLKEMNLEDRIDELEEETKWHRDHNIKTEEQID